MNNNNMFVSDFDGTFTQYDFYDLVTKAFPEVLQYNDWTHYEEGKITHFEALRRIFSRLRSPEHTIIDIINKMTITSNLTNDINTLNTNGWNLVVASAGCDWYIKKLLGSNLDKLTLYANPGTYSSESGLSMTRADIGVFSSDNLGVNKLAIVEDAMKRYHQVAFAGDGRPDLEPVLIVPSDKRFAKGWLAQKLDSLNEAYVPFSDWSEIIPYLIKE
ncbi:MAG: HAD-IB family phosphatase [Candidatus Riflemargulisbacteria bacterium]